MMSLIWFPFVVLPTIALTFLFRFPVFVFFGESSSEELTRNLYGSRRATFDAFSLAAAAVARRTSA